MAGKIKGLIIRTDGTAEFKTIEDKLETYYKDLNCDCIDIVTRYVGNEAYSVVCDDEALLKENPIPTIFNGDTGEMMIFGNAFVCRREGPELASITDEDVSRLRKNIGILVVDGLCKLVLFASYKPHD